MSYEGSKEKKMLRAFLAQFWIPYDKLSMEQVVNLIEVLKLSPYWKNAESQRGKAKLRLTHEKGKWKRKW